MTSLLAGVIGWPVSHSLSPSMHRFWLQENGIDGSYEALPVCRHDLSRVLDSLQHTGFVGVNLTLPHKEAGYAIAHTADPTAHTTGAANLLLLRGLRLEAYNTDVEGLLLSLRDTLGKSATGIERAVVLGAGGAARAAVLACDRIGTRQICILNRTKGRADALVRAMTESVEATLTAIDPETWAAVAPQTRLLINATSSGLGGSASPDVSLECLPGDAAVCDLVYNPLETPLLARARARGLLVIDGLGMLMHQGALAFELLFAKRPTVSAALRAHLEQALPNGT